MTKSIVSNGCSFTQELYLNKPDRWTTKCGVTTNLALGGGSNERIFYTTIEQINLSRPDVIVIGWTQPERFMLPNANGSRVVITPIHSFDENTGEGKEAYSKFFYKYCANEFTSLERTLNYMLHLQQVCESMRIKLLYFNAWLPEITETSLRQIASSAYMSREDRNVERMGIEFNFKKLNDMIDRLDKDIWIKQFWYSMTEHCKDFPREKDGHPAEAGSAYWASLVKQYL